ncbi:Rha family transcriptional regulator [Enterococcus hulanensis]|uniref:Rha family transcriptional regulator n=1 Tax=Enterococcus hulanensis TaxID=2559929 RepID=UPI00288CC2C5|nr:Rha family transcriptional regulator [Enterococcus hulanensis]MDT2662182.1 Rha family transcriptional regulator [Enterococcus hulanensis]
MNQLTQTLTSNEVAEMIGTTNGELMKSIRTYIGYLAEGEIPSGDFFIDSTYKDSNNQERPNYLLTKQGCEMVSNKLTGPKGVQFTAKYVSRFNQMEEHIKQQPKIATTQREQVILALQANEETNQRVDELDTRVADLEENTVLSAGDYGYISRRINQRVAEVARGFGRLTQEQRGKLYKDINSGVKAVTGVSTRTQLRNRHYETVLDFINDWEPSTATKMQVRQMTLDLETA